MNLEDIYRSPEVPDYQPNFRRTWRLNPVPLAAVVFVATALGVGLAYMAVAITMATPPEVGEVHLSTGQQFALVMLPLTVCVGGCGGAALALWHCRQPLFAGCIASVAGAAGFLTVAGLWRQQRQSYGDDVSETTLYMVPLIVTIWVFTLGLLMLTSAIVQRIRL